MLLKQLTLKIEIQTPTITGFMLDTIKDSTATIFDLTKSLNMAANSSPTFYNLVMNVFSMVI
jgi:hypothetical protein